MIRFEKVSYEQFKKDYYACVNSNFEANNIAAKIEDDDYLRECYDKITLPTRSTSGSAGYDFVSPFEFKLAGGIYERTYMIPTGIKAIMPKDAVLMIFPRSGMGFKTGMRLANTVGVIDSDYQHSSNEGHIMARFMCGFDELNVKQGDRIMQGVFMPYFTTDDDNASATRSGGLGSTGK